MNFILFCFLLLKREIKILNYDCKHIKFHPCLHLNYVSYFYFPVATPKQIRELMQVDGLTNDEVKSHLQVCISA